MPTGNFDTPLSLATVCEGDLEEEFQEMYPKLIAALREGDKGTITITLEIARIENTDSMLKVGYKIKPQLPSKGKASICAITKGNKLLSEAPVQKPHIVPLFSKSEGGLE